MIIRIRTNLRTLKEDVPPTSTLKELLEIICAKLLIDNPSNEFTLSRDIFGKDVIESSENETLEQLNLHHGDEIHVLDRFDFYTIEKDYINDNHEIIKAGKRAKVSEFYQIQKQILKGKDKISNIAAVQAVTNTITKIDSPRNNGHDMSSLPPPQRSPSFQPSNTNPYDSSIVDSISRDDDISVRVPDEIQKVQLIESPALRRPELTSEDYRLLNLLRKQLTEAGFLEGDVELQVEEEINRILSERAINQLRLKDRLGSTFGTMSTLDELEALLLTHRTNRFPPISSGSSTTNQSINTPSFRRKFNDRLLQQTGRNMISNSSLSSSNVDNDNNNNSSNRNNTRNSSQQTQITSKPPASQAIPSRVTRQHITTNNQSTSTAISTFSQICQNGNGLVQVKNSKLSASNLPSIRGEKGNSSIRNRLVVSSNNSLKASLEGQNTNNPSVKISPRPPLAPPSQGQKQNAVAAVPKTAAVAGISSAPNSARSNSSSSISSARQAVRRPHQIEQQSSSIKNSNISNSSSSNKDKRKERQEELLQSKVLFEAQIGQKLQQKQPQQPSVPRNNAPAAVTSSTSNNIPTTTLSTNERNIAMMRRFLQQSNANAFSATNNDNALPSWLQQDINADIDNQLLQLARNESCAMISSNNRNILEYNEDDDEALAKALQASLDEY